MKRWLLFVLCVLLASGLNAQILDAFKDVKPIENSKVERSLNGVWKFALIRGLDWSNYQAFYKPAYNDSSWNTIPVPGNWDIYGFTEPRYDYPDTLTGFYRQEFVVPSDWSGQHVMLRFDGVLRAYDLWINGQYAGKWESAFNTCQFDITPYLNPDGKNLLAMRVYTIYKGYPFDCNDDWAQVGIARNVTLYPVPVTHISDMIVRTLSLKKSSAIVGFDFNVSAFNDKAIEKNLFIQADIINSKGKKEHSFRLPILSGKLHKEVAFANPLLWTAETPSLYRINYSLCQGQKILESLSERFGIREIKIDGKILKLNGTAIKLRGVTLHATDPASGKVISEELNLKDMRLMKAANVNCIRTSHYPHEPRFYELCDSLGFYVIDEVPFGYGEDLLKDTAYQDILLTRAKATVQRDKNHPSVIVWSVGNENPLTPICMVTGQYVQKMDPSRPICYPMIGGYFDSLHYNIPSFVNIYAPHYPTVELLSDYAKSSTKPMIFTEYCHSLGQSFEQHPDMWEIIEKNENMAGGCIWEWVDQGMPFKAHRTDFYQWTDSVWLNEEGGFRMAGNKGTDGLLYANRIPLSNYYALQHDYAQAQVLDTMFMIKPGKQSLSTHIRNRYDFINLQGNVQVRWCMTADKDTVQRGSFTPDCAPHAESVQTIFLDMPQNSGKLYLLHFDMLDKNKQIIGRQVAKVNEMPDLVKRMDLSPSVEQGSPLDYVQQTLLMRVGHKTSLSEDNCASKRILKHYLMKPKQIEGQNYLYENDSIRIAGTIRYTNEQHATKVSFNMKPEKSKNLLLEAGLAFLLDPSIQNVQWLGNGPFASYPGKTTVNNYGFHSLRAGDLYFEGNRMGVDAVLCTNDKGDGILMVCRNGNVNFEQTDRGIVLTYNAYVSGLGPKWNITRFPVYANQIDAISGSFYLYKVDGKHWNKTIDSLFSKQILKPFSPFKSQYDNYLLKFGDIVGE